ncbi:uncharacterized protein E0L32_009559 [Thyridium curvatum]|uniref:RRM domain-containing protein n=1 Tax=Thyridium curvatum TaxID=1093900 RepID=A0A507AXF9_9PEZI|nr:uncharacterized protein E0L32_009559 [Thyridium curvatum]TPX08980.1 hypothetical protein E0L32_009559 [Thyridium curvatum]
MSKKAADLEKMIHTVLALETDRAKKKNEALAARIFGKDRRTSAPPKTTTAAGGSLASRSGVKKRLSTPHAPRPAASDINGSWTHDLHDASSPAAKSKKGGSGTNSLASRITVPGAIAPSNRRQRRAAQVAQALIKTELQPASTAQGPIANAAPAKGMTIRGLAGPFAVMAQNFAPGTTAADIESAVTPVGGLVSSCKLLKTQPIVIAEIVFESREGAERVIETFNNQTADGRVLHVYPKVGGFTAGARAHQQPSPSQSGGNVVDGSMGFDEPMEMDAAPIASGARKSTGGGGSLYSDKLESPDHDQHGEESGAHFDEPYPSEPRDSYPRDEYLDEPRNEPHNEPRNEPRNERRSTSPDRGRHDSRERRSNSPDGGRHDSRERRPVSPDRGRYDSRERRPISQDRGRYDSRERRPVSQDRGRHDSRERRPVSQDRGRYASREREPSYDRGYGDEYIADGCNHDQEPPPRGGQGFYERSYNEHRYNEEEQVPRAGEYSQHSRTETSYTEHSYSTGSDRWNEFQDQRF